jgi:endonuclease I
MNKIKILISALVLSFGAMAQAPLPTSENFNAFISTSMQPGWSTNIGGTFTYATGVSGTAGKIDIAGEYVMVNTVDAMGVVSYYLKGWNTGGAWLGVFTLEESVLGATWTALQTYSNTLSSAAYTQYTVTPNPSSRYLRWILTTKATGNNVGIDDVNITAAPVTAQEINVKQGLSTILTGGGSALFNSAVGTPTAVNFTIENLGTINTLSVSSILITGVNAADFTVSAPAVLPTTVGPSSNIPLTLSFNPSAAGTRSAIMTINNNDLNESAYVINLNGIGGLLATAPTTQASALTFNGIKSYRAKANFVAAAGTPNGYLILKKQSSSAITDVPVDGVAYQVGDAIGSSKVIYSTSATTIGLSNVFAGLQYQIAIFTFDGSGVFTNYNQTAPLTGNFTALGSMQPISEYSSLNVTNPTFLTSLSALIYPHTSIFYGNYDETMIKLFTARDTTAGQKVVTCVYSSDNYVYTEPFAFSYISREHSYCHNWMPTNPADGSAAAPNNVERKEYNDQHHLFPTNQDDVNAVRSNYPMGEVTTLSSSFLLSKRGQNSLGKTVFEPRSSHKGDFARAVMYMATAYNTQNNAFGVSKTWEFRNPISTSITYGQDQNILKKWHYQDPPDAFEISRNDFLDSLQGNRNPFIDSMRYACYIDFSNMTYIASPTYTTGIGTPCYAVSTIGLNESSASNFEYILAPNPSKGEFNLMIESNVTEKYTLMITDVTGRNVCTKTINVLNGFNTININDVKLQSGIYFVNLIYKNQKNSRKLIIE